jgi:hypothetical protein
MSLATSLIWSIIATAILWGLQASLNISGPWLIGFALVYGFSYPAHNVPSSPGRTDRDLPSLLSCCKFVLAFHLANKVEINSLDFNNIRTETKQTSLLLNFSRASTISLKSSYN